MAKRLHDAAAILNSIQEISGMSCRSECLKLRKFLRLSDATTHCKELKFVPWTVLRKEATTQSSVSRLDLIEMQRYIQEVLGRSQMIGLGLIQWARLLQNGVFPGSGGRGISFRDQEEEGGTSTEPDDGRNSARDESLSSSTNVNRNQSEGGTTFGSRSYHTTSYKHKDQNTVAQGEDEPSLRRKRKNPRQHRQLSENSRESVVPSSRVGRLANYGSLAVGLGVGAIAEVTRQTFGFSKSKDSSDAVKSVLGNDNPFLTEANAERIVDTLCRVRGAALKLGQMLSIQDNAIISPQLQSIFARVRDSADFMPARQVEKVMRTELGEEWRDNFREFEEKPFAAASIGQVHRAVDVEGREIALKIQYPGVATSINSDIRNLMSVMKMGNLIPRGLFLDSFVPVARKELALECDYINEAAASKKFRKLLEPHPEYHVPQVMERLTTKQILTTELVGGVALDKCVDLPQESRDWLGSQILFLCLRELFQFNFMQTDPNWSNFLYDESSGQRKLVLLDFGASRAYDRNFVEMYIKIIKAASEGNREDILKYSREIGFLTGYESKVMNDAHCDAVVIMGESLGSGSQYDFGDQNITGRLQEVVMVMLEHRLTPPPEQIYSLHRKLSGAFLICAKLGSRVWCKPVFDEIYDNFAWTE